jgi:arylformamidase
MNVIDISRPLTPATAVWPGDRPIHTGWSARIGGNCPVNIGEIAMSTHAGTHVDAPLHYQPDGASVDAYRLDVFIGEALVVEVADHISLVTPSEIEPQLTTPARRVLFKSRASRVASTSWNEDFPALAPELIDYLADRGVCLIGTDSPSVDPADSKTLDAHHRLCARGVANIENLLLEAVRPGKYTLLALPLKLDGLDAAPVRAVLLDRAITPT